MKNESCNDYYYNDFYKSESKEDFGISRSIFESAEESFRDARYSEEYDSYEFRTNQFNY